MAGQTRCEIRKLHSKWAFKAVAWPWSIPLADDNIRTQSHDLELGQQTAAFTPSLHHLEHFYTLLPHCLVFELVLLARFEMIPELFEAMAANLPALAGEGEPMSFDGDVDADAAAAICFSA